MDAAFGVLADNPCNDEAVFAALAIMARCSDAAQVRLRQHEFWKAIDGPVFFKRLLLLHHSEEEEEDKDKGGEASKRARWAMAINFLSPFCHNAHCAREIRASMGEELIQACVELAAEGEGSAASSLVMRDCIDCCVGLESCTGTTLFLLPLLTTSDDLAPLHAFATTCDPFLFEEDAQRAVDLLSTAKFAGVAVGLANRLENGTPKQQLSLPVQRALFTTLDARLRTKDNSAADRRALLVLAASALLFLMPARQALPKSFLLGVAVLASVEVDVGLSRAASEDGDNDAPDDAQWARQETKALLASVRILDRARCWLMIAEEEDGDNDVEDSGLLRALVSALDSASRYLASSTTTTRDDDALHAELADLTRGIVLLFWSDDPAACASAVTSSSSSSVVLAKAMQNMARNTSLRGMMPMLARLEETFVTRVLGPLRAEVEREFVKALEEEEEEDALCFAGHVLLMLVAVDHHATSSLVLGQRVLAALELKEDKAKNTTTRTGCCRRGVLAGLGMMLGPQSLLLPPAAQFIKDAKQQLEDEEDLFSNLHDWPQKVQRVDLERVLRLMQLECESRRG